ncbi:MAG TPA: TonB-dependent receptor [Chitinophagaceae bacterium]|nr:TonB-dependent receptor [Chitinophagaceae bacterium]
MKRIAIPFISLLLGHHLMAQEEKLSKDSFYTLSPVEVRAIRAGENAPFTKTNLGKKEISRQNLGQDIPFLLNQTPSVVINSDAGNGIGYTGIRIRGTDATRINVTLNGIPYNDAESQGTFFVDLPDFSSSTVSMQIQRGVGTSSNGAGAFGASINISTNEVNKVAYAEINNSYGSFDTWKNTIKAGTGLLNDHFTADIRLSNISSAGFIDRASSDLKSFYFSTAWLGKNNSIRFNIFSGKEKTYQAWYGISQSDLDAGNRKVNYAGTEKPGEPYKNETDNYKQDHYQLFFEQAITNRLRFNTAIFLTRGKGFYEQYKADQELSSYGLPGTATSDLIRQLWLDNNYYGNIFSFQYKDHQSSATLGGAVTRYEGRHFGEITWASAGMPAPPHRWYDHDADKKDFTIYLKEQYRLDPRWVLFGDLQYRHAVYKINGFRDNPDLLIDKEFHFFNPKAGITYSRDQWKVYLSYSLANKEPNRDDFEAGLRQQPKPERLQDWELGVEQSGKRFNWSATVYYMRYKDQLVLTGKINDVGAYTRTNIPESYRAGVELQGGLQFSSWLNGVASLTLSRNKVNDFLEYIDDYDNGGQKINSYGSPDIAYSPAIVGAGTLNILPLKNVEISFLSKYVSDQFLDNTQNEDRKLDAFFVQDLRVIYTFKKAWLKELNIIGQLNNVFSKKYEPNGYTYSYIAGGEQVTENYYFPMAGRNFMVGVNVRL